MEREVAGGLGSTLEAVVAVVKSELSGLRREVEGWREEDRERWAVHLVEEGRRAEGFDLRLRALETGHASCSATTKAEIKSLKAKGAAVAVGEWIWATLAAALVALAKLRSG